MQRAPGRLWFRPAGSPVRLALNGVLLLAAMASIAGAEVPRNKNAWAPAAEPKAVKKPAAKPKRVSCPKKAPDHGVDARIVVAPPVIRDARLTAEGGSLIVPPVVDSAIVVVPAPSPSPHDPCHGS